MKINSLDLDISIDYLVLTEKYLVACGYAIKDSNRFGELYFLDINTFSVVHRTNTTGTLQAFFKNGILYTANSKDVTAFKDFKEIFKFNTENSINTCIFVENDVYVGDINGNITIYDINLNKKEVLKITTDPIWTVKLFNNNIYAGDEAGHSYFYNLVNKNIVKIDVPRLGILDIFIHDQNLYISSYDENLMVYEPDNHTFIKKFDKIGTIWKTIKNDKFIACSCIYEGVKIFDLDFNLIKHIKTDTICYGICFVGSRFVWSPFYNNRIEWIDMNNIE